MPEKRGPLPIGFEPIDPVKEKEALYADLKEDHDMDDRAFYLSTMIAGLRCGLLDEKAYKFFSEMGVFDNIPFEIMAFNLRNKLLEDLEKEFAAMDAGSREVVREADQDENGIAECVRDAVVKVES